MKTVLIAMLALALTACGPNYSNGTRAGTVVKMSTKGLFCTMHTGQMVMGGLVRQSSADGKSSSMVANTFEFDVVDREILEALQAAADSGTPVTLEYREWFIGPFCSSSSYVVTKVR